MTRPTICHQCTEAAGDSEAKNNQWLKTSNKGRVTKTERTATWSIAPRNDPQTEFLAKRRTD
jgi:hypothetical protein